MALTASHSQLLLCAAFGTTTNASPTSGATGGMDGDTIDDVVSGTTGGMVGDGTVSGTIGGMVGDDGEWGATGGAAGVSGIYHWWYGW